jgi:hypothetical protein
MQAVKSTPGNLAEKKGSEMIMPHEKAEKATP